MNFGNKHLLRELANELNTNLVIFTADGFATLGNLQQIIDCRILVLTPASGIAGVTTVRTLGPGGLITLATTFVNIDVCQVVAKATGLSTIAPF